MRITIDARMMSPGIARGIGRYIEELLKALAMSEHHITAIVRQPSNTLPASITQVVAAIPWYGFAEQWRMPGVLAATKPDVVHIPHWSVPIFSRLPRVVTIHDILLLSEPASAKVTTRGPVTAWIKRMGYRVALHFALFRSRMILVPTQYVADDLHKHFPTLKTPMVITGEGMPEINQAIWSDPEPYLLYVGSAYPHKDLDSLLDAWKKIASQHPSFSLILAGERDVFMKRVEERVEGEQISGVRFPGHITDADLPGLYGKATAFVFPSRQEGFGLPPLEAMAYGCPVIVAQSSCLPEVLGQEGVTFFRPGDADDILRAVSTVLEDPKRFRVAARQAVVDLAQRHTWKQAAEKTFEAYQAAVSSYASSISTPHSP